MLERNNEIKSTHEMKKCSSPIWYKDFESVSIKSYFLKIPNNVLTYLRDEIIILPAECSSTENEIIHEGFEDEDTEEIEPPTFPEFSKQITKIIKRLGGSAFIKTNWHCPKDAFWITAGQTMKCKDITDVYTLIKASSVCKEDLINHSLPCGGKELEYFLVFKKWKDIHTGTEFRCFVRNKNLVAISPRDWPEYHEHMSAQRSDIIADIVKLFKNEIKQKFTLMDYVFDVVRDSQDEILILDFSPFGDKWSDSLAFSWEKLWEEEFEEDSKDGPEFRYLASDCGIQPNKRNNYGIPRDVVDMFKSEQPPAQNQTLEDIMVNRVREELDIHFVEEDDDDIE